MNTRTLPITALALLAFLPAARVLAQQPAASAPAETTAVPPATAPAETTSADAVATASTVASKGEEMPQGSATKTKDAAGRDTLSVDFPDEDIRNILRNVSDLFELNIVMPDALQGKTTIKLRDVTWRQIFQSVLAPVNHTYVEDGNIIKIVNRCLPD
jgi:type IV pilus assembly protein PilQ